MAFELCTVFERVCNNLLIRNIVNDGGIHFWTDEPANYYKPVSLQAQFHLHSEILVICDWEMLYCHVLSYKSTQLLLLLVNKHVLDKYLSYFSF